MTNENIIPSDGQKNIQPNNSFPTELVNFINSFPYKREFLILFAAWILIFHYLGNSTFGYIPTRSIFSWLYSSYNARDSDDSHGNLVPFVVLALIWWKRKTLQTITKEIWFPALSIILVGSILHIIGYSIQQPRISAIGFFVGLYGIMGLVWGIDFLKNCFFPYFLFIFSIPISTISEFITFPLRLIVAWISELFSNYVLSVNVIRHGTQLIDPTGKFSYDVAPACSGIRSLISMIALLTIFGFLSYRKTWKRICIILLSIPIAIAGNVIRIISVIIVSEVFGIKAGMKVHDWGGYLIFIVALATALGASTILKNDNEPVKESTDEH